MNPIFYEIMKAHAPALFEKVEPIEACQWETDEFDARDGKETTRWCVTHDSAHLGEDVDTDAVEDPYDDVEED